ncbi:MAG: DUF5677 domain-containing protein [Terriglobia bacterium]
MSWPPGELSAWIDAAEEAARKLKDALLAEEIYVARIPTSTVPFAHLTKAFQVHEAVMTLCRAGFGSEAFALSRIILEMFINLRWITNQEQNKRTVEFAFFGAKRKEYAAKTFAKYRPGSPVAADALKYVEATYKEYADRYDSFKFWSNSPNNLRALAEEKETLVPDLVAPDDDAVMLYEIWYSEASDYVHVTSIALDEVFPPTGEPYAPSREKQARHIFDAVFHSTQWLFTIMLRVDTYRKLGLQAKIDQAYRSFAKLLNP